MPVPEGDRVCRFIRPSKDDWSVREQRPKPGAFKHKEGISVWHKECLQAVYNADLEDLRIGSLTGAGQALHTVADYHQCAADAAEQKQELCRVSVEWRSDSVPEPWWQWRDAHIQVDALEGSPKVIAEMRRLLAGSTLWCTAPDGLEDNRQ